MIEITALSTFPLNGEYVSTQNSDLTPFLGGWSHSEKKSEIKLVSTFTKKKYALAS